MQEFNADLKEKQINFSGNLDQTGSTTTFFIIEEGKETVLDFSEWIVKVF